MYRAVQNFVEPQPFQARALSGMMLSATFLRHAKGAPVSQAIEFVPIHTCPLHVKKNPLVVFGGKGAEQSDCYDEQVSGRSDRSALVEASRYQLRRLQ